MLFYRFNTFSFFSMTDKIYLHYIYTYTAISEELCTCMELVQSTLEGFALMALHLLWSSFKPCDYR